MQEITSIWIVALSSWLLTSCSSDSASTSSPSIQRPILLVDSSRLIAKSDSVPPSSGKVSVTPPDTLVVAHGQILTLEPVTKAQYLVGLGDTVQVVDTASERRFIAADYSRVSRVGKVLSLKPAHGPIIQLRDGPKEPADETSYEGFSYLANLASIGQWVVAVNWYEGGETLLVDQKTGKRIPIISYPVMSPDSTHFICANFDPSGFTSDGLQLWRVDEKGPQLQWQRLDAFEWGATAPRWRDNRTVIFQKRSINKLQYARLKVL